VTHIESATAVILRDLHSRDLDAVVEWHLEHFPHSFYARLGRGFMARFYEVFLSSPDAATIAAVDAESGDLVGYLVGTTNDRQHRKCQARTSLGLAAHGAVALARRPRLWPDFVQRRAGWYLRRAARAVLRAVRPVGAGDCFGELLYMITGPDYRGQGVGGELMARYSMESRRAGARRLHLVTESGNLAAVEFYESRGWQFENERRTRDGRPLTALRIPLDGEPPLVESREGWQQRAAPTA
jgi:ribosomal protein S18 acetylase RimI-like enzyme